MALTSLKDKKLSSVNIEPQKNKFELKMIFTIVMAVLLSLVLVYAIYFMVFKKESFLVEKFIIPKLDLEQEIKDSAAKAAVSAETLTDIEKSIIENKSISNLKLYGDFATPTAVPGKANPFLPFDEEAKIKAGNAANQNISIPTVNIENKIPQINSR